jgi:hypothetical protein
MQPGDFRGSTRFKATSGYDLSLEHLVQSFGCDRFLFRDPYVAFDPGFNDLSLSSMYVRYTKRYTKRLQNRPESCTLALAFLHTPLAERSF